MLEWEGARHAWEDRIRGLENQKKALLEKSDMTQVSRLLIWIIIRGPKEEEKVYSCSSLYRNHGDRGEGY